MTHDRLLMTSVMCKARTFSLKGDGVGFSYCNCFMYYVVQYQEVIKEVLRNFLSPCSCTNVGFLDPKGDAHVDRRSHSENPIAGLINFPLDGRDCSAPLSRTGTIGEPRARPPGSSPPSPISPLGLPHQSATPPQRSRHTRSCCGSGGGGGGGLSTVNLGVGDLPKRLRRMLSRFG